MHIHLSDKIAYPYLIIVQAQHIMWLLINMCTNRSLFLQQLRLVVQLLELLCSAYIMYFLNNICGDFYLSLNWNRKNIIRYFNGQDCFIIHPTPSPPPLNQTLPPPSLLVHLAVADTIPFPVPPLAPPPYCVGIHCFSCSSSPCVHPLSFLWLWRRL